MMNRHYCPSLCRLSQAFSLVEVVLALGLVSFCLLAVVGLLPVGLKAVKNAHEESAAASAFSQLADALRNATGDSNGNFSAAGVYSNIIWASGNSPATATNITLALSGLPTNFSDSRLVARVEIHPAAADGLSPARARISVAWPSAAVWTNNSWSKFDGSLQGSLQFLPRK